MWPTLMEEKKNPYINRFANASIPPSQFSEVLPCLCCKLDQLPKVGYTGASL